MVVLSLVGPEISVAQRVGSDSAHTHRVIHRDVPLSEGIRRALKAGTRDSSGFPGSRYWQLWTDYTIHARLDPATSRITGREIVVIQNPGPKAIDGIVLRRIQ